MMSSYDALQRARPLCESVTNNCVNYKDQVWPTFLANIAPVIKTAEILRENDNRQNCVGNVVQCFRNGCADQFDPDQQSAQFDLCTTNPEAIAHICRQQLLDCGLTFSGNNINTDHFLWTFIVRRMSAMRDNACTREVKACMANENNCGENFSNCMGMDMAALLRMCPMARMVSCHGAGYGGQGSTRLDENEFADLIMGILLNVDNEMLRQCQAAVDSKMTEICGSTEDCDGLFANDDMIGIDGMVLDATDPKTLTIKGLIDFSKINQARNTGAGATLLQSRGTGSALTVPVMSSISIESGKTGTAQAQQSANGMVRRINNAITMLVNDEKVRMCIDGRDVSQIDGSRQRGQNGRARTDARFPYIADSAALLIIDSGVGRAQENHARRVAQLRAEAAERIVETILSRAQMGMCYDPRVLGPIDWMR